MFVDIDTSCRKRFSKLLRGSIQPLVAFSVVVNENLGCYEGLSSSQNLTVWIFLVV
jgi:hypothetical protein